MSASGKSDPANYRAMSVPHDSLDAADAALQAFAEDVRAARQKHRIADVLVAVQMNVVESGEERPCPLCFYIGSGHVATDLAAFVYGFESKMRDRRIASMIAAGESARKSADKS